MLSLLQLHKIYLKTKGETSFLTHLYLVFYQVLCSTVHDHVSGLFYRNNKLCECLQRDNYPTVDFSTPSTVAASGASVWTIQPSTLTMMTVTSVQFYFVMVKLNRCELINQPACDQEKLTSEVWLILSCVDLGQCWKFQCATVSHEWILTNATPIKDHLLWLYCLNRCCGF